MTAERIFKQAIEGATFSFKFIPEPIPGDLRMSWGISIVLLSLIHCRSKKASFQKLPFLAHAVRTPEGREDVRNLLRGRLRTNEISVRVEPWLNRAVSYAHALGLASVLDGKSVRLTTEGEKIALSIGKDPELLRDERLFLFEAAKKLNEAQISKIWRMEDLA